MSPSLTALSEWETSTVLEHSQTHYGYSLSFPGADDLIHIPTLAYTFSDWSKRKEREKEAV